MIHCELALVQFVVSVCALGTFAKACTYSQTLRKAKSLWAKDKKIASLEKTSDHLS